VQNHCKGKPAKPTKEKAKQNLTDALTDLYSASHPSKN